MKKIIEGLRVFIATALLCAMCNLNAPVANAAGSHLDFSLSSNGKLQTDFGSIFNPTDDVAWDIDLMSNGKIVVAGESDNRFAVARYNANGTLDTSFGGDGRVTTNLSSHSTANAVALQADGKIVVAGYVESAATESDFAVLRYKTDGTLDETFSGDGAAIFDFNGVDDRASSVAIQADGKIVVAGLTDTGSSSDSRNWGIARLNSNGTLDTSFDGNGRRATDFSGRMDSANDVLVQSDGRIVVVGFGTPEGGDTHFAIARYNSNGAFDTTFGDGGKALIVVGSPTAASSAQAVTQSSSGKYILAGRSDHNSIHSNVTIVRLTSSGVPDVTFGGDGIVVNDQHPDAADSATDVVLQADGKIVASYSSYGPYTYGLLRYLSDGTLDPTFGTGGRVNTIFGTSEEMFATAVAFQFNPFAESKLVVAGGYLSGDDYDFAVARYGVDGIAATSDFVENGESDFAVFRPSNGRWYFADTESRGAIDFGQAGDVPTPGDYDGDGETDAAVFRGNVWYIRQSSNPAHPLVTQFGLVGDKPVQGDYDGDGKTDIAVYRPSSGVWHLQRSTLGYTSHAFGTSEDKPAPGDYDGDGLHDLATFRPSNGTWYLQRSTMGYVSAQFGLNGDRPVAGDYDGDTKTDIAVFRPSTGSWYALYSQTGEAYSAQFGLSTDIPAPADFNADGRTDVTIFRPSTGHWWVLTDSGVLVRSWGLNGDVPVPSAYAPQ